MGDEQRGGKVLSQWTNWGGSCGCIVQPSSMHLPLRSTLLAPIPERQYCATGLTRTAAPFEDVENGSLRIRSRRTPNLWANGFRRQGPRPPLPAATPSAEKFRPENSFPTPSA